MCVHGTLYHYTSHSSVTSQERDDWRALLEVELQVVEVRGDRTVDLLGPEPHLKPRASPM